MKGNLANSQARGQLIGAFAMGLGMALMEEIILEEGRVTTTTLGEYKLPTISDVPSLRVELLESDSGSGPFGARSIGELANPAISAAIANAVHDAVGARITSLPLTAEKVFRALGR